MIMQRWEEEREVQRGKLCKYLHFRFCDTEALPKTNDLSCSGRAGILPKKN